MFKEHDPRATQREIKPLDIRSMPFQLAFGETAKKTPRGIIVKSWDTSGDTTRFPKVSVDQAAREKFGMSALEVMPDLYSQGLNPSEISEVLECSESSVEYWLTKAKTERRTRSQALRLVWDNSEKKKQILSKSQSPEANKKRKASLKRFYSKHPDTGMANIKRAREKAAENAKTLARMQVASLGKALGANSEEDLKRRLQDLYDKLGSVSKVRKSLDEEKGLSVIVSETFIRKTMKKLEIRIKGSHSRGGRVQKGSQELFERAKEKGFLAELTDNQREAVEPRFSEGEDSKLLSYQQIADLINARQGGELTRQAVQLRVKAALRRLKKLAAQAT